MELRSSIEDVEKKIKDIEEEQATIQKEMKVLRKNLSAIFYRSCGGYKCLVDKKR